MRVCIFGLLMTDVNFLIVSKYYRILPGGYWFILLGPLLDGSLGGMSVTLDERFALTGRRRHDCGYRRHTRVLGRLHGRRG